MTGGANWRRTPDDDRAEAQPALPLGDQDWLAEAAEEPASGRRWPDLLLPAAMLLLAIAWVAVLAMIVATTSPMSGPGLARAAAWVGIGCGPLTLLALLALVMLRTGRSEATRYARAARELRTESLRLAELLTLVDRRIASARQGLAKHGAELVRLGEETSDRLGRAGEALRGDMGLIAATAARLDDATATARTDLGVILADMPGLEGRAGALGDRLRGIGQEAEARGASLAASLQGIEIRARAADQGTVAAARRLAIELERIEGSAAAADRRIGESAGKLGQAADAALADAAGALDQVRRVVVEQGTALTAVVGAARDALGRSGDEAGRALAARLDELGARVEETSARIATHESAARGLLGHLEHALEGVERRFQGLGDTGAEHVADLAETLATLAGHGEDIGRLLGRNGATAEAMLERVAELRAHVAHAGDALGEALPAALARLQAQADAALGAIDAAGPRAADLVRLVADLQTGLAESDALIEISGERMERLAGGADARLDAARARIEALEAVAARAGAEMDGLAEGASVRLVDALLRVRDTATQAALHARETLAAAIPEAAARLGSAGAEAMAGALHGVGRAEIEAVRAASTQAADAAGLAADRLNRQLLGLTETTRAVEARIAEHEAAAAASDERSFARQTGLLIEALNSTAIDVAKILSNDPTDAAWAAYLKGDRGVFTRRAVRLLDGGDARAITARYHADHDFHDQVNRYVHDFEAMLRRVLAVREGASMGVTLLSSDMGKLYVALAQAIERLRR